MKILYLSRENKKIGGVCGGIGEYFEKDPTLIRIIFILLTLMTGIIPGIFVYLVLYMVIPEQTPIH